MIGMDGITLENTLGTRSVKLAEERQASTAAGNTRTHRTRADRFQGFDPVLRLRPDSRDDRWKIQALRSMNWSADEMLG
jgi:hypothetical protein